MQVIDLAICNRVSDGPPITDNRFLCSYGCHAAVHLKRSEMTFHSFHQQTLLSLWGTGRGLLTFAVRSSTQIKTCSPSYRPAFIIYWLNLSRPSLPAPVQAPMTDSTNRHVMTGVVSSGWVEPKDGAKDRECFVGTVTRLLWEFRFLVDCNFWHIHSGVGCLLHPEKQDPGGSKGIHLFV